MLGRGVMAGRIPRPAPERTGADRMTARACRLRAASAGPLARADSTLQIVRAAGTAESGSRVGREHVVRRGGTLERVPPRAHRWFSVSTAADVRSGSGGAVVGCVWWGNPILYRVGRLIPRRSRRALRLPSSRSRACSRFARPVGCFAARHDRCLALGAQVVATLALSPCGERRRESAIAPPTTSSVSVRPAAAPIAASPQSKPLSGVADGLFGA